MMETFGLQETVADLGRLSAGARHKAGQAVRASGQQVKAGAQALAPYRTGNLINSIGVANRGDLEVEVGPTADYGIYVELGTSKMAAQPYLGPAFDAVTPVFEAAMQAIADGRS